MKNHVAKQIAAIVLDTLERNTKIAISQGPTRNDITTGKRWLGVDTIEAMHRACANNLGQVIAEAIEGEIDL